MQRYSLLFIGVFLIDQGNGQIWQTGDNSTLAGCRPSPYICEAPPSYLCNNVRTILTKHGEKVNIRANMTLETMKLREKMVHVTHCSVEYDGDLSCWNSSRDYFERAVMGQMRHYIAVQVDIDQWHRRHGKEKNGSDMNEMRQEMLTSFLAQLTSKDILSEDTVTKVVNTLADRIVAISDHTISWVPHFRCPMPCEYRHDMYKDLLIASLVLNAILLVVVIPFIMSGLRRDAAYTKEALLNGNNLS